MGSGMSETSDIRTKIEALLDTKFDRLECKHLDYIMKLEYLVRASVGLVEALSATRKKFHWALEHSHISRTDRHIARMQIERIQEQALAQFAAEVEGVKS